MHKTVIRLVAASAMIVLLAAGCGDDGDSGDDVAAYCEFVAGLDAADDFPSDDDLDRVKELAPSEISDQVAVIADAFKEQGEEVFDDPSEEFITAGEEIEAFESENCDGDE